MMYSIHNGISLHDSCEHEKTNMKNTKEQKHTRNSIDDGIAIKLLLSLWPTIKT